jgi:hypothetical protein
MFLSCLNSFGRPSLAGFQVSPEGRIRACAELAKNRIFSQPYDAKGALQQTIIWIQGPEFQVG